MHLSCYIRPGISSVICIADCLSLIATYGYAKQYSGVNLGSFVKHITSSNLTAEGLVGLSSTVEQLAAVEGLDAHKRAVTIRVAEYKKSQI